MIPPIPTFMLSAASNFGTAEANVLPIVFAALLLDVSIVAVWYFIGVVLANSGIRESAKGEYYQFLGTAFLIVVVLWGIAAYSGLSYTLLGTTKLMSPSAISTLCTNIETNSPLIVLGGTNSLLSGAQTPSGKKLVGICSMVDGSTITDKMNYPLVAAAVVTANMTAQTANNLNGAYIYDSYIGFLSQLKPVVAFCFAPPEAEQCIIPGFALLGEYFRMSLTWTPYAGYNLIYQGIGALGTLLNLSFEAYIAQLLIISIILYIWPYLLFAGIVLRSTFFTRKIGGLFIAIVLGAIIVFPTLYGIEYLALGNGVPGITAASPANATYGFNALSVSNGILPIPSITTVNGQTTTGNYLLNFYVQPNMQQIAMANGCWPTFNTGTGIAQLLSPVSAGIGLAEIATAGQPISLYSAEAADIFYLLNPTTNLGAIVGELLTASVSNQASFILPAYCPPTGALNTNMEMLNAYGIIGVTSYFLPIINLIMTLSAIIGLSGLMGGNTSLEGLSRFV
jgi:hypothetical protein